MFTKEAVAEALVSLLENKPLDLIRVQECCQKAGVGRTSFYKHFNSKVDVLKYIYRKAHYRHFQDKFKDLSYLGSDAFIKDMISFFDMNTDLLNVLFK